MYQNEREARKNLICEIRARKKKEAEEGKKTSSLTPKLATDSRTVYNNSSLYFRTRLYIAG